MDDVGQALKELAGSLRGALSDPIKGFGVLQKYALHRASLATGIRREQSSFSKLARELESQQTVFEWGTRELAAAADKLLRRHGAKIVERQLATARMADMMIHLYVLACTLSRVSASIAEHGAEKALREIQIAEAVASRTERVVRFNVSEIEKNADDQIKALADHAFEAGKYSWDTI
jgi:glutamate racemase